MNISYLWLLPVFKGKNKIKVSLVVHLAAIGQSLLKDPGDERRRECVGSIVEQFLLAQHAIMVLV